MSITCWTSHLCTGEMGTGHCCWSHSWHRHSERTKQIHLQNLNKIQRQKTAPEMEMSCLYLVERSLLCCNCDLFNINSTNNKLLRWKTVFNRSLSVSFKIYCAFSSCFTSSYCFNLFHLGYFELETLFWTLFWLFELDLKLLFCLI